MIFSRISKWQDQLYNENLYGGQILLEAYSSTLVHSSTTSQLFHVTIFIDLLGPKLLLCNKYIYISNYILKINIIYINLEKEKK